MIDFNQMISNYLKREKHPKQIGRYYPSEIGSCMRKVWYTYKQPKEIDPETVKVFHAGNMIHEFVVDVLKSEKNPGVELLSAELPFFLNNKDFLISGRIDNPILVKQDNQKVLVEVKSTKMLDLCKEPSKSHVQQLQLYMHSTGVHKGLIIYVEKHSLKCKEFDIDYDQKAAETIIRRFEMLHSHLKGEKIPLPEAKLDPKIKWMCNYCEYRKECDDNG